MLSDQYLQRYRERGDAGDADRARAEALRSLRTVRDYPIVTLTTSR